MGETVKDSNDPIMSCILTKDNVVLVQEGVVADINPYDEEFDDEDDMQIYFEEDE